LQAKERLQVFLTNTLEPLNAQVNFLLPALSKEGKTAQSIKNQPILVITGNPPYSGHSTNKGSWIAERVNEYKKVGNEVLKEKNPKWLQDDYVKFIRFAEWKMQQVAEGMVAIITNHSFLDNPTFRLMRKSLMTTFNQLYIIDLHGNAKKQEKTPEGEADQNVFDIQQGVSISIFIKKEGLERKIFHTDFYGKRKVKYDLCLNNDLNTIKWNVLQPQLPHYLFVPQDNTHKVEYEKGWSVKDIFHLNNIGVLTHRDAFLVDFSENILKNRIKKFQSAEDARRVREWFDLHDTRDWSIKTALNEMQNKEADIRLYAYRPFDNRYVCYNAELVERQRYELMQHFEKGENIAIITGRAGQNVPAGLWNLAFITDKICDANLFYRGGACVFPLFYYNGNGNGANGNGYLFNEDGKKDNFSPEFRKFIKTKYFEKKDDTSELTFLIGKIKEMIKKQETLLEEHKLLNINGLSEIETAILKLQRQLALKEAELEMAKNNPQNVSYNPEPLEVFYYIYAFLHSPNYRKQYEGFLKMDFPRVPFVEDLGVFRKLSQLGKEIADAHLLKTGEWEKLSVGQAKGIDTNEVDGFYYENGRLYYNKTQYFEEVSAEVWEFQIGGYTVLEKYLKDRKGKNIENELTHIQNIIKILTFTLIKGQEVDTLLK
jgi:predicted helicase